jgi:hypothetical protein
MDRKSNNCVFTCELKKENDRKRVRKPLNGEKKVRVVCLHVIKRKKMIERELGKL